MYLTSFPNNNHHTEFKTPKQLFFCSCQEVHFYVTVLPFQRRMKPNFREARLRLHNFAKLSLFFADFDIFLHSVGLKCGRHPLPFFYSSLASNTTTELCILTHFHTSVCFSLTCACYITQLVMYGFRASSI